jgi:hypothetical protein
MLRIWLMSDVRLPDEPVTHPMKKLYVQLRLGLEGNKTHCRTRRGFCNRFRIAIIVLLRLDMGTHILRRHQPHVVALLLELPSQVMGTATRLHCDDTNGQFAHKADHAISTYATPEHYVPGCVKSDQTAAILAKVNADNPDVLHVTSPCPRSG